MWYPHMADMVRDKLRETGLSQNEAAKVCGVSPQLLSMIQTGKRPMTKAMLLRLECLEVGAPQIHLEKTRKALRKAATSLQRAIGLEMPEPERAQLRGWLGDLQTADRELAKMAEEARARYLSALCCHSGFSHAQEIVKDCERYLALTHITDEGRAEIETGAEEMRACAAQYAKWIEEGKADGVY